MMQRATAEEREQKATKADPLPDREREREMGVEERRAMACLASAHKSATPSYSSLYMLHLTPFDLTGS